MALICLSRDHAGKRGSSIGDRGASADLDGDGVISIMEQEAMLTPLYIMAAENALIELGHDVIVLSDGWYSERHERAKKYKADVYIACHLNAGPGNYGSAFFDYRSSNGMRLATRVGDACAAGLPALNGKFKSFAAHPDKESWTRHAFNTISGVYDGRPAGLCFEPFFLTNPDHQVLATPLGLKAVGRCLAAGINSYF